MKNLTQKSPEVSGNVEPLSVFWSRYPADGENMQLMQSLIPENCSSQVELVLKNIVKGLKVPDNDNDKWGLKIIDCSVVLFKSQTDNLEQYEIGHLPDKVVRGHQTGLSLDEASQFHPLGFYFFSEAMGVFERKKQELMAQTLGRVEQTLDDRIPTWEDFMLEIGELLSQLPDSRVDGLDGGVREKLLYHLGEGADDIIVSELLDHQKAWFLLDYWDRFEGLDDDLVFQLLLDGYEADVMRNINRFDGSMQLRIVRWFLINDQEDLVIKNLKRFKNIPQEEILKMFLEHGFSYDVLQKINFFRQISPERVKDLFEECLDYAFEDSSYSLSKSRPRGTRFALVLLASLDVKEGESYYEKLNKIAENLDCFQGGDKFELAKALIDNHIGGATIVLDNLHQFPRKIHARIFRYLWAMEPEGDSDVLMSAVLRRRFYDPSTRSAELLVDRFPEVVVQCYECFQKSSYKKITRLLRKKASEQVYQDWKALFSDEYFLTIS